jgi:hypothetical protein
LSAPKKRGSAKARAKTPAAPPVQPEAMTIEWWPIDRCIPYPKNARIVSDRAVATLAASIKEFGWRQPIVVDVKNVIIMGHTRLLAGKHLALARVPVHVRPRAPRARIRPRERAQIHAPDDYSYRAARVTRTREAHPTRYV